ncbi:hypothetical protein GCM10023347_34280 [Streptomyces chumphonensis]|uniref:Uncharacterized protein n=1 Tax=Streptomyces chumphonensis TaxID=1214925 RepID=A0A927EYB8_9ACTN|nr:DUF6274 family protein [Streptomyces chumphonensis]MBD3931901.1 hypothetical protein [Streptomyces chumphonensis]
MGSVERGRRRETAALLRAHLSAAAHLSLNARYRHVTRRCPVCHRLLLLAQEEAGERPSGGTERPYRSTGDESPGTS